MAKAPLQTAPYFINLNTLTLRFVTFTSFSSKDGSESIFLCIRSIKIYLSPATAVFSTVELYYVHQWLDLSQRRDGKLAVHNQ